MSKYKKVKTEKGLMDYSEYCEYMLNKENIRKCDSCPENCGRENIGRNILPCGQYHCEIAIANSRIF